MARRGHGWPADRALDHCRAAIRRKKLAMPCSATVPFPARLAPHQFGICGWLRAKPSDLLAEGPRCSRVLRRLPRAQGRGNGPAAVALTPAPRDLTAARLSVRQLSESIWNGRPGSSMPPWNDLTRVRLARPGRLPPDDCASGACCRVGRCRSRNSPYDLCPRMCRLPRARWPRRWPRRSALAPAPTNFHEVQPTSSHAEAALRKGSEARQCRAGWASFRQASESYWRATFGRFTLDQHRSNSSWPST